MDVKKISNEMLSLDDIPGENAMYREIEAFALSFNAYEYHDDFDVCDVISNASMVASSSK